MKRSIATSVASVWEARDSMLMQLDATLEAFEIETRDQFTEVMQAAFGPCALSITRFAGYMRVSPSSAHRWVSGASAPHHEKMWHDAASWIRDEIKLKRQDRSIAPPNVKVLATLN